MFVPGLQPPPDAAGHGAFWFVVHEQRLLVRETAAGPVVSDAAAVADLGLRTDGAQYLGLLDGRPCFALGLTAAPEPVAGCAFRNLRELFALIPDEHWAVAGRALQLAHWNLTHRFCSRCGGPVAFKADERAKFCAGCGLVNYPQIAPAVIVAVRRGRELLLARNARYANSRMFSILAGFVEAGENLEECAHREVREEVGIEICGLRYFGSQAWPFPNSLMLGFTAEYAGGEIRIDATEILEAGWFAPERLPQIPSKLSISRALIDHVVAACQSAPP